LCSIRSALASFAYSVSSPLIALFSSSPYQSVGNEHGVLEGIVVERMMIQQEEGEVVKKEAVVALYKGKLSRDGTFQMILNHKLISA